MFQRRKVQRTVVADKHALVFVDEIGEEVTRPVVLDGWVVLRRIAEEGFAPVGVAGLFAALQVELHDVAEIELDGFGADGTVGVAGNAVVGALVAVLVRVVHDEVAAGGGET